MRTLAAALLAACVSTGAPAQEKAGAPSDSVSIEGAVAHKRTLSLAELQALPPVTVETDFVRASGQRHVSYTGAALWPLLSEAGPVDEPGEKTFFRHVVIAHASDGYAVALSIGELDPNGEGKSVIIAYAEDGKPEKSLRLVVPGDHHAARSLHDLTTIEVR
jgi:DMSO/TMAO reductase YedYZ molybdopterin-dependent catalytic subunit